ncbi:MAG: tetratricopeptide repeat protein [Pseudoxanthomonas sp.]
MPVLIRFCLVAALAVMTAPASAAAKNRQDPTPPGLEAVMAGEFAYQAGRMPEAAQWYLQAAQSEDGDAGLAERATRIALLANDDARAAQALKLWRQRAPASLAMRGAEAVLALRQGKASAARRELLALLREPDPLGWRYALVALDGGRNPELSARLLQKFVDDGAIPGDLSAWLAFGGLAQHLDQPELADRIVAEVVGRFPSEPRVALLQAAQLRLSGKPDDARQVLAGLDRAALLLPQLRFPVADEYLSLGDPAAAAAVLARGPQDNDSYGLRASLLARAEDRTALTALYDELRKDAAEPDPARRLLLGQIAQFLERPQEALDWYRSVPGGPQRVEARLRIANSLFDLGRKGEAFEAALELQRDAGLDDDARVSAYLLEAELRQKDGDDAGELDALARGLAAYPDDSQLLYARALGWERRDDIARAEADFRKILAIEPDSVAALNALGYTLADRTNRYQEALELINRARAANPDDPAITDSYGWVLYRLGRREEALVELRRAFGRQKDAEIASHLAEVLWALGRQDEARKYFDEARKLDPDNRSLKRALEKTGA